MKIKKNKIYLLSTFLGISMVTALTLGLVLPSQGTIANNAQKHINNNNEAVLTNDEVSLANDAKNEKVVTNSDFIVNDKNAITLEANVGSRNMTSISVGPRGFLTDNSTNIIYMGTNGSIIWQSNIGVNYAREAVVLSSYYNAYSKCFVVLYAHNINSRISVVTISESNGKTLGNYDYNIKTVQYNQVLMYEVIGTPNVYGIYSRHASGTIGGRWVINVAIGANGNITPERKYQFAHFRGEPWSRGLAAGAIRIGNDEYFFSMQIAAGAWQPIQMYVYKNGLHQSWSELTDTNNGYIYNDTIFSQTNITQVWLQHAGTQNKEAIINFGFILNGDTQGSGAHSNLNSIKGGRYIGDGRRIERRDVGLQWPEMRWNIYNGRILGDYFYGLIYNENNNKLQLLRLYMDEQWDSTWNTTYFKTISESNIYNAKRLAVYTLPSALTARYERNFRFNIFALPMYSSRWDGTQDIMSFWTYNGIINQPNISTNLWILDSQKSSLAYKTRLKGNSNQITIPNVSHRPVGEVTNADLENYIRPIFSQYFTQYQDRTSFTITKKNNSSDVYKGTIAATIKIDSGYNNNSLSKTSVSLDILFTGFKTFSTSINTSPENTNDLINILPQSVQSGSNINAALKKYIYQHVVNDDSKALSIDDVALINVKSYNNLTGTLILESIGLNRWISEQGIIQNSLKLFNGPIVINGLREINATTLVTNNLNIPQIDLTADGVTLDNLKNIIFTNRDNIFTRNSLPDEFKAVDIVNVSKNNVDNINGNLLVNFQLSSFYSADRGTLTNSISSTFALLIDGFKFTDHGTGVVSPLTSINELTTFPYQIKNINSLNVLKHFILENVVSKNKVGLTVDNIVSIQLDPTTAYDNKNGILYIDSITLNKWYNDDGTASPSGENKVFKVGNGLKIAIQGLGRIGGFTSIKSNIVVNSDLINTIPDKATEEQILAWLNSNMNMVFSDLPSSAIITGISNILTQSSVGEMTLDITLNSYFDNDNLYTYKEVQKTFSRVVLRGMKVNNYSTYTISPITNIDKTIITELPQFININNDKFKTFLLNNVIQGKKDAITIKNITDFQVSTYSNLTGSLTLSNITLDKWYDANGVLIDKIQKFENGVTINGFSSIATTQINTKQIDSGLKNVLPSNVTINDMRKLIVDKKDDIFVANGIPTNFSVNNIVDLNIVNISNAKGTLDVFFIINNWYETSQGRLETSNSTLFSLNISGFWSLSESSTAASSDILINSNFFPYEVNETNFDIKLKEYLYSFVLQGNKTDITAENIVGIKLATNPYDNKNGTLKLKSILMNKYYDINGSFITTTTPFEISPANGTNILIKGFLEISEPTNAIATPIAVDETLGLSNINEVKDEDLKVWVDAEYKNILSQIPIDATITAVNKVLNESNSATGELIVSITIDRYFDTDETYSYKKQPKVFKASLKGFKTIVITDTNQNQQAGMPDWSWYLIYGGAGLLGLLLLIWIITAISKKNKRSRGMDDYDF